jgi:hypothetical protein
MPSQIASPQLVEQRIRNRIIEWLEALVTYQVDPPPYDLNEVLNQWEDWSASIASIERYAQSVYTAEEGSCLVAVGDAWSEFCEATPTKIIHESKELSKPELAKLVAVSDKALGALRLRGKLSEEGEVSLANPQA